MKPEEEDEMMIEAWRRQIRANYRRYLGREYQVRSLDRRIKKLFEEKKRE